MKKYVAAFVGTFVLVFARTSLIVINEVSNGVVTHVGIAFTFGLVGMTMIYPVGDVSGALESRRDHRLLRHKSPFSYKSDHLTLG